MKRCPSCQRAYADDTLIFCLEDGSTLLSETSSGADQPATLIMNDPRITLPGSAETAEPAPMPVAVPPPQRYIAPQASWTPAPRPPQAFQATAARQGRGLAIASLVLAITAFLLLAFCFIGGASGVNSELIGGIFIFAAFLGLTGAVLGIVAVAKAGKDMSPQNSKVTAVVALVLNCVYLFITLLLLILGATANS
ncbi:MAG TPA: hypothetical protein VF791_18145 [Pyrinomonadaceae bacterium]